MQRFVTSIKYSSISNHLINSIKTTAFNNFKYFQEFQ